MDFAKLKQANERLEAEKDNLNDETKETQIQKENMEEEQRRMRKEVKDYKVRRLSWCFVDGDNEDWGDNDGWGFNGDWGFNGNWGDDDD